ncbi:MAG TPA: methyltransferase [Microlunatus sp.]|nr:methyltransferase [Microlunatus sp.]
MTAHYFTGEPAGPERRRRITARIWDRELDFTTANGVFSADGLDHATSLLLRTFDPPAGARRVLDLGCGWGPIAIGLALAVPELTVDAVDVNDRALRLCRDNARAHGVAGRVTAIRPDQADPDARYDELWSNPPIRIGKAAVHDLLLTWLPRLAPDGVARLVVGKNLGADSLQRWLVEQGYDCDRVASAKGFRVFVVSRTAR